MVVSVRIVFLGFKVVVLKCCCTEVSCIQFLRLSVSFFEVAAVLSFVASEHSSASFEPV